MAIPALQIEIPNNFILERQYIISVIFNEFLGLDFELKITKSRNTRICLQGKNDHHLIVADGLFNTLQKNWLKDNSLPTQPLQKWNINNTNLNPVLVSRKLPIIYRDDSNNPILYHQSRDQIYLGLDIFGSAFFMLTRYEEIVKKNRDKHGRFPVSSSLAYQEDFLCRPIINEYVEVLWSCLELIGLEKSDRKNRDFEILLSHDVDQPFKLALMDIFSIVKLCGGDILKQFNIIRGFKIFKKWIEIQTGSISIDPYNTFSLIMNLSENHNLQSSFYFIAGHSNEDPRYDINHKKIRKLIREIFNRGHEIGLHPSYASHLQPEKLKTELNTLKKILQEEGVPENIMGGRQHYLCWQAPETWQYWNDLNFVYDSSVGFAEHVGFRCGCCYEYTTFNCITRQSLELKERPLIFMDCSLFANEYMNLSYSQAEILIQKIIDNCQLFNGSFTMLWHNSQLISTQYINFYTKTIEYALSKQELNNLS